MCKELSSINRLSRNVDVAQKGIRCVSFSCASWPNECTSKGNTGQHETRQRPNSPCPPFPKTVESFNTIPKLSEIGAKEKNLMLKSNILQA